MSLFTPEPGLIIWMLISFFIVVFILGRFIWPSLLNSVAKRAEFIDQGVENAKQAARKLEDAETQEKSILEKAHSEQIRMMNETESLKERLLEEARQEATREKNKLMEQTQQALAQAKKDAVDDIRKEIVALSIQLSEKILREDLSNKEAQEKLIDKMLQELQISN